MEIKAIIASENPDILLQLERIMHKHLVVSTVTKVNHASRNVFTFALKVLPDVVVIDLNIIELLGIDILLEITDTAPNAIILFITEQEGDISEKYSLYSFNCILKPIQEHNVYFILKQVKSRLYQIQKNSKQLKVKQYQRSQSINININNIIFIERNGRETIVYTHNKLYKSNTSLDLLEKKLGERFYRSHRSFLVNIDYIERIEGNKSSFFICFLNIKKIALLSRRRNPDLLKKLKLDYGNFC